MNIYIESAGCEPVKKALKKVLDLISSGYSDQPIKWLEYLAEIQEFDEKPDLILHYIPTLSFEVASRSGFLFHKIDTGENDDKGNPLYHRRRLIDSFNKKDLPFGEDKSHFFPIIYVTEFLLNDKVSDSVNNRTDSDFLDSSIWHRAVSIKDPEFIVKLLDLLKKFSKWLTEGLYKRIVAAETLDYHSRMLQQQRVKGDHSTYANLHIWGSECNKENLFNPDQRQLLPRRFLLVDDYGFKPLRYLGKSDDQTEFSLRDGPIQIIEIAEGLKCSKSDFIYRALSEIYDLDGFELWVVRDIESAKQAISVKFYDVILIDYILEKGRKGVELLDILRDESKILKGGKGKLLEKYWIFVISSFPAAVHAEIACGKLSPVDKAYRMHPGADPVSTPALFKEKLFHFLDQQEKELFAESLNIDNQEFDATAYFHTLRSFLIPESLKDDQDKGDLPVQPEDARECYYKFISEMHVFKRIQTYKQDGSLLSKKILMACHLDSVPGDDLLWEDLHSLVYMIAYSPPRSWPKMWDEYLRVKEKLPASIRVGDAQYDWLVPVRDYIIDLQKKVR